MRRWSNFEQHAWTLLLYTLLMFFPFGLSFHEDLKMKYSPKDNHCALKLKRSQLSHLDNPYMGRGSMELHSKKMNPKVKYRDLMQSKKREECILYKDVNEALAQAKRKLHFVPIAVNSLDVHRNDIDTIGTLIIETTRILARKFKLTFEEINEGLPTIDTSKTDIWDVCPAKFKPTRCSVSRFRNFDGQCSCLKNSILGSSRTPFSRMLPPAYSNGIDSPRTSPIDGSPLPHVRRISTLVHPDITDLSDRISTLFMSFGQFIGHDIFFGAFALDENGIQFRCCHRKTHRDCMPIILSKKDPYYSIYNSTCITFMRTIAGLRPGCALGPRAQLNLVSTRMDANYIYGSTKSEARRLRLGRKGMLKSWPKFHELGLKDLPPPLTEYPDSVCNARPKHKYCFLVGDERAHIQPHVLALQIIYLRAHNRIAEELGFLNRHWDDERIYQETRHILAAVLQHSVFKEFLPILIGPSYMHRFNLTLKEEGYWNGYDKNTRMVSLLSFQTAAMRFGHSTVHGKFNLYNKHHKFLDSLETRDVIRMPYFLYSPGALDKLIAGFLNSPIETFDPFMTVDLTKHLFQVPKLPFGQDLASLNINRGRDHALPGYNDFRERCGLPRVETFEELSHYLKNGTAFKFSKLYRHPDELDLWTASLAERAVKGGIIGPTFACIIALQFDLVRKGDRFWYENPGFPSSFTPAQLRELRKVTQAKIICENADDIPTTQMWALLLPHPVHNPRVNCKDLPELNLKYWIEDPKTESFKYTK